MLQEPVTNSVLRLAGLPATATAYVGLQVNGKAEQLYTLSEVIDDPAYLKKNLPDASGVLYKAELNANMNYQGEDPSAYARSFTLETHKNDADLAPLIKFLKFISQSDDRTFEQQLPTYLDVDAFAAYLAVNNLLVNNDSMVGMGNNFYLYYDTGSQRFTVLMWDGNESLGKQNNMGRGSGIDSASFDIYYKNLGGFPGGGGRGGSNLLSTRFLANAAFKALYEQKLKLVYEKAFVSGAISRQIDAYTAVVRPAISARGLVNADSYEKAVASVRDFIARRQAYLATTPLLGKQANLTP
jgi:spore coat protein CotH